MELNTQVYNSENTSVDEDNALRYTAFSSLPINTKFDISGAYAMGGGMYNPYCNRGVIFGGDMYKQVSTVPPDYVHHKMPDHNYAYTRSYVPLFFQTGQTGNAQVGYIRGGYNPPLPYQVNTQSLSCPSMRTSTWSSTNNDHWSPNATAFNNTIVSAYSGYMLNGFRFDGMVVLVEVRGTDVPGGTAQTAALDDYDFANYPCITNVSITPYNGDKQARTRMRIGNTNVNFAPSCPIEGTQKVIQIKYKSSDHTYEVQDKTSDYTSQYNLFGRGLLQIGAINSGSGTDEGKGFDVGMYTFLRHDYNEMSYTSNYWYDMTHDDICHMVATLGFYFAGTTSAATSSLTGSGATDDHLYCPVPTGDIYMGDYVQGEDIKDAPNADNGDGDDPFDWWKDNGVSPDPDTNDYTKDTPLNRPTITAFGAFNRAYAMSQSNLNDLCNYLWNTNDSVFDALVDGLRLYGENPMNALIDCRMYPFDILSYISSSGSTPITIGRNRTTVTGVYLGNTTNCIIDLGACQWREYHKNFLDYAPYSGGEIYIPYVGKYSLDPNIYCGHTVQVYLIVDFMTGACQAVVYCDGIATEYKSGQMGVDVPMSGVNAAQWASGVLGGIASTANGALGTAANIATGNFLGAAGSAINTAVNAIDTYNTPLTVSTQGTATAATGQWLPQQAYLTVFTPVVNAPSTYGSTIGYACNFTASIGSLSGFTVCANANVSSGFASEDERREIEQILKSGFYA